MDRYSDIVPSFDAFRDALERPLPLTARANRVRASRDDCVDALRDLGLEVEPIDWFADGFEVAGETAGDGDVALGTTLPHHLGWMHVQEEVSMVPPVALDPDPDDVVIDLCAAPGSKATQLAQDAAAVVANDDEIGRIPALRNNADRLGCTNLAVTNVDGRRYPGDDRFDAALVDVPCSAEGTARKLPQLRDGTDPQHASSLAGLQRGLLERAVDLTRPGGTVVYSTCTFAPEENEAVVAAVTDDVRIESFDVGLTHEPGLTEWEDERFPEALIRTHRYYPHQNDTGGFYVAKLRVT